jgi:hypothetical protein
MIAEPRGGKLGELLPTAVVAGFVGVVGVDVAPPVLGAALMLVVGVVGVVTVVVVVVVDAEGLTWAAALDVEFRANDDALNFGSTGELAADDVDDAAPDDADDVDGVVVVAGADDVRTKLPRATDCGVGASRVGGAASFASTTLVAAADGGSQRLSFVAAL